MKADQVSGKTASGRMSTTENKSRFSLPDAVLSLGLFMSAKPKPAPTELNF
jgi:hypothetical protein